MFIQKYWQSLSGFWCYKHQCWIAINNITPPKIFKKRTYGCNFSGNTALTKALIEKKSYKCSQRFFMYLAERFFPVAPQKSYQTQQICFVRKNRVGRIIPLCFQIFKITSNDFFHYCFITIAQVPLMLKQRLLFCLLPACIPGRSYIRLLLENILLRHIHYRRMDMLEQQVYPMMQNHNWDISSIHKMSVSLSLSFAR